MKEVRIGEYGSMVAFGLDVRTLEDGTLVAEVSSLPGIHFHGETIEETVGRISAVLALMMIAADQMETTLEDLWKMATSGAMVEIKRAHRAQKEKKRAPEADKAGNA